MRYYIGKERGTMCFHPSLKTTHSIFIEMKSTNISLQLEDRSKIYSIGILEDVPIRIMKLFVLTNFVTMEMDGDSQILIILGTTFLATTGATINVK